MTEPSEAESVAPDDAENLDGGNLEGESAVERDRWRILRPLAHRRDQHFVQDGLVGMGERRLQGHARCGRHVGYGFDEFGGAVHDVIGTRCDPYTHNLLSQGGQYHHCCHSNLTRAFAAKTGMAPREAEASGCNT